MIDLLQNLVPRQYNAQVVTLGVTLLGIAAAVVGCFALLRKRALMGDALAHATLPGIAGAFLAASAIAAGRASPAIEPKSLPVLLTGAAITAVLGVLCVHAIRRFSSGRIPEDAALGAVLSVFFGAGFVLLSHIQSLPTGNQSGLKTFITGQPAAMSASDAALMAGIALAAILAAALLFKEFRLVCFDEGFARVQGWPVSWLDLAMMALIVLVTVAGLQAVGLILVIAMLVVPPAAARFFTDRFGVMILISAVIGAVSGYLGVGISASAPRLPTGAVVVLVAGTIFLLSALLAPHRGVISGLVRARRLGARVQRDHALRAIYEWLESASHGPDLTLSSAPVRMPIASLRAALARSGVRVDRELAAMSRRGVLTVEREDIVLSSAALRAAATAARNHRLWEQYLVSFADVAPSHVDRAADMVEHVLSPELIASLERQLRADDRRLPPSVHPLYPRSSAETHGPSGAR